MQFSPQQDAALTSIEKWLKDPNGDQFFYLAGFAGTGKTTIAKQVKKMVKKVLFGAFTGKAALVMASKGCRPARTIHSLIYRLKDPDSSIPEWVLNEDSEVYTADLVVIDEVSMVGPDLGADLLSFGVRVLVLGDPAQLPPIKGMGYFTSKEPDAMLTEVHRQARNNPIIQLSMDIREGREIPFGTFGESRVISTSQLTPDDVVDASQVLVGKNDTRRRYNARVRTLLGYEGFFEIGEKVVTLKNDKERGILNGGLWDVSRVTFQDDNESNLHLTPRDAGGVVTDAEARTHHAWLTGREREVLKDYEMRGYQPVDYGYVLSCHKAQGSQWDDVLIFDESYVFRADHRKWLYTAITRAAERVTIVRGG